MTRRLTETLTAVLQGHRDAREAALEAEGRGEWREARRWWREAGPLSVPCGWAVAR